MSVRVGAFAEANCRGPLKRRSGASSVVASGVSSGKRPSSLGSLPSLATVFHSRFVDERVSINCHGNKFCFARAKPCARESFAFLRVAQNLGLTGACLCLRKIGARTRSVVAF